MPLIERAPIGRNTKLSVQIDPQRRKRLDNYCRFAQAKSDRVVLGALDLLFRQDGEFTEWERTQPGAEDAATPALVAQPKPTGRVDAPTN